MKKTVQEVMLSNRDKFLLPGVVRVSGVALEALLAWIRKPRIDNNLRYDEQSQEIVNAN